MKTRLLVAFGIILIIISAVNYTAYGLWDPEATERLLEQSETVFVGTITSVNVLEFERSNTYDVVENGVSRIIIENYTQTLDEYTVSIEEFLKNPQESHTITMLEATVGGVPGRSVSIGGFELGDRVLFYVPKIDGTNQYSPESFKIPKHCDAKSVLEKPKIVGVNDFRMMQDGTIIQNNFTANKKIQFVFDKDLRTLKGAGFSVDVAISKIIDKKNRQPILQESIHAESKQCEWVASAKWDFVPTAGEYAMWMSDVEDGDSGRSTYSGGFSVIENTSIKTQLNPYVGDTLITSPLQQFKSGIEPKDIVCKQGLELVMKKSSGQPICVKGTSMNSLTMRNYIPEYNGVLDGPIPTDNLHNKGQTNPDSKQFREITVLSISPKNVTLPDNPKDKPKITSEAKIPIDKSKQIKITNNDTTNGLTVHSAQITLKGLTVDPKGNPPAKLGFDTWVFDYSIQNTDSEEYYAMPNFEVQFGQKTYSSELVGDEFYWTLTPGEKRDASYAIQVGKGINQVILNVKDQTTKKILWSIPLDLTPYKIKYHTGHSNLIQE